MDETKDQYELRKKKIAQLEEKGIESYPASFGPHITVREAAAKEEGVTVRIAGRLMSKRLMGKASFSHIKDYSGRLQVYVRRDNVGEEAFAAFKEMDIGDFMGVEGEIFITKTGEKTVLVKSYVFLAKSLRPLPEKWHGLKDTETRYRKRYLDILVNPQSSDILKARSIVINEMRNRLLQKDFVEVETPILQDIPGGASARPFKTFHNTFGRDLYLRIAPELYLKRLLVGGWDRVFEIGRNFRNEGISTRHNPEFTMLEVYCAYTDYRYMMELSREIIISVQEKLEAGGFKIPIDFSDGWEEKDLWALLTEYTGTGFSPTDSFEDIKKKADKLDVPPGKDSPDKVIDRIFSKYVEENLVKPTFVTGYLSEHSPLAKRSARDGNISERFEIFICGQEVGNAYSEQNDPAVQKAMFESQLAGQGADASEVDTDYIEALEYGMPPASGLGIGIDRIVMLMTGAESIREVILFPMLKPVQKDY
ncbi:MAG: lysine--tRNA ligase [Elusimicrobia bacterium]|nr:lysine--tRNA ligase [Elusimicrobiota bacterium]